MATEGTKFRFDDLVVARSSFESGGTVAKVAANFGMRPPPLPRVKVFGTEGTFVNGPGDATLWTDRGDRSPSRSAVDSGLPGGRGRGT